MLFVVLALLLLAAYLIRRFSAARQGKGTRDFIEVLAVHHFSPKEKLVLVTVQDKTLLIGVTPSHISSLTTLDNPPDPGIASKGLDSGFSALLRRRLNPGANPKAGPEKDAENEG